MEHQLKPESAALIRSSPEGETSPRGRRELGPYGFEIPDDNESQAGVIQYLRILRRHSRAILAASAAGLIFGFAIGIPMKPVYRVRATLEVLSINEDFMNLKQANPNTTNDNTYDTSEEQTQAKLLQSSALLNRVIEKLEPKASEHLAMQPARATHGWRALLHLPQPVSISPHETLLSNAAASLKVKPTSRTRILEITVDSTDPQTATDFANTLCQEFITQNVEARWKTTQLTSQWLSRELGDARDNLRSSENALQKYASGSGLIFTDEATNVATEKLQQVQQNLSAATADRISKQSRYELAQSARPDTLGDVLNDTTLRETQAKITDLKRQVADLSTVFSPEYSKIRRLQAELNELEPAFQRQVDDILAHIKNDFTESSRRERLLAQAYSAQASEVTGQDEKAIQYNILKRDVDSNRQLYDTMLQQMKQSSIASALHASNVRVVDHAAIPNVPVSPNFMLNSALGLLAGLFCSIVAITVRERADRAIHQPGDIELWSDLTELGVIPAASSTGRSYYSGVSKAIPRAASRENSSGELPLLTLDSPGIMGEAFRSTLTSVLFMAEAPSRPKVLAFTSASAGDGKTTVSSNLAIAAAEIRMKVLVIDADLRRPRMHSIFDLRNDEGLVDILRGDVAEAELPRLIQTTRIQNLSVLTAGAATQSASHLLYSPVWSAIIEQLRREYDMIFVDTPPMLQVTDARVASRLADAVVLVCRSAETTRDALLAAKKRLTDDRTKILGAVLNDWNPKNSPGGYYGYYRGNYYGREYGKRLLPQTTTSDL